MIDRKIGKIKVRRGTDSQRVTNTFEEGEIIYSVDKKRIFVGDDTTLGGVPICNRNYIAESLGEPPTIPDGVLEGDIVHDKSNSKTYIVNINGSILELLLIADGGSSSNLKLQISDIYNKLTSLTGCLTPPPEPPKPPSKLNWVIQPIDNFVKLGDTITFAASAIGDGNISYVWKRIDNSAINTPNIYRNSITITNVTIPDIATYYCVASNSVDSITSRNVALDVESDSILAEDGTYILSELSEFINWEALSFSPPVITKQPLSMTTIVGNTVTFSIEATGTAPLTYQWKVNGYNVFGEINSTYKITNATADKNGITCTVSNLAGDVLSNSVNLIVGTPPVITKQPTTQSISKGSKVSMSVVVTGSLPFDFQWSKDGSVINGATSDTYTINTAALTDAGSYSCTVSNIFDSVTSNNAVLTVNNNFDAGDLIIAADTYNFVLKDALITKGWDTTLPVVVNVYVNSGVTVGSNSTSLPAFKVDSFPAGSVIKLTNNGSILGAGGNGGIVSSGGAGGTALNVNNSITIINNNIIGGGGGGGGAGGYATSDDDDPEGGHGGGGSGAIPGVGEVTRGTNSPMVISNGLGGSGGGIGTSGSNGGNVELGTVTADGEVYVYFRSLGYAGGVAGYYIEGNSFVTWTTKGDVKGNVK